MSTPRNGTAALIILCAALGACESPPSMEDHNNSFGEAINHNIAVQVVDPLPQGATVAPTTDAARASLMMDRYRNDKVKQPGSLRTSGIGSTSGEAGGGAAGFIPVVPVK